MGLVDELLSGNKSELLQGLTEKAGFTADEATKFLPPAAEQVVAQVKGGGFDLSSLLGGGGVSSLISNLDIGALAANVGIEESKVTAGLQTVVPLLLSALQNKAGGASGVLSLLGGDTGGGASGALGKLGGLFKK